MNNLKHNVVQIILRTFYFLENQYFEISHEIIYLFWLYLQESLQEIPDTAYVTKQT